MALPRWLHLCRHCTRACAETVGTLLLWTLWLALCIALVAQVFIAFARELPVPEFALRRIEQRLAAAGLQATFGAATFEPGGHLLLRDLRVSLGSLREPVLTAETMAIEVDPWALLVRTLQFRSVHLSGAELRVPAMLSPSGRTEPVVRDLEAVLHPSGHRQGFEIPHLAARVGPLHVHVQGAIARQPRSGPRQSVDAWLREAARVYPRLSRQLADQVARLPFSTDARLSVELTVDEHNRTLAQANLAAAGIGGSILPAGVTGHNLSAQLQLRLPPDRQTDRASLKALVRLAFATSPSMGRVDHLTLLADGTLGAALTDVIVQRLDFAAAGIESAGVVLEAAQAQLELAGWPSVSGFATARGFNEAWHLAGTVNSRTRSGELELSGAVAPALLAHVGERLGRDLAALVRCEQPPHVQARVVLGNGGRPLAATGRVRSGPAHVRGVALSAASGVVRWHGESFNADEIVLTTAGSEARGSYEMNLRTRDFRFLLNGRLQPADIDGWFREWWPNFWSRFAFTTPPAADVEVSGRWGVPLGTAVFVAADGASVALQGAEFERIRTRLFVRPGFTDVIEFVGERGGREARGHFTRAADLATGRWTQLSFDVRGDTDLAPARDLFGDLGTSIVRPFHFSTPPRLDVQGTLRNATADTPREVDVRIRGTADGDWRFHDFPLHDLRFQAHLRDEILLVEDLEVGFAGGRGTGRAELRGWDDRERQLAFDLSLSNARLGESIRTLETWSAERQGQPPPPVSRFQQQVAAGRLDLDLSAVGRYDDPYSLHGAGHAVITGAELGEIHLLGILSALLRPTIFNFTTLQLDTARANFDLVGPTLEFRDLRLTGARAAIEAQGGYRLDTKGLSFAAKIRPFELSESFLGATFGLVLTPLSSVLEVKLTGVLDQPSWAFVYGPTNFLRVLSGDNARSHPAPSAPGP